MWTMEEFMRCANIQAKSISESRGAKKPREMVINPRIKKELKLGNTVTLDHIGEIPLVADKDTVLFMFNGFTEEYLVPPSPSLPKKAKAEKVDKTKASEVREVKKELPKAEPVPKPEEKKPPLPLSQRKRAVR